MTLRKHPQRGTPETCDLWDIWSELWGEITWPTKKEDKDTNVNNDNEDKEDKEDWEDTEDKENNDNNDDKEDNEDNGDNDKRDYPERVILEIYDLWDTDHISDNWEQQS